MLRPASLVVPCALSLALTAAAAASPTQTVTPPALADGAGKDVVTRVCGECHDAAERITKHRKTETEWADIVTDMQNRGMAADDKEIEVVLAYLTRQYGNPAPPVAASRGR